MEARRIAKMTEFADFYPPMYERIVDHLHSMRALAREIDDLNRRRPDGSVAGIAYSTPASQWILRFPTRTKTASSCGLRRSRQSATAGTGHDGNPDAYTDRFVVSKAAAGTYIEERHRRMLEDNRKQIAEAEQRQREREEREAAEARKAQEAERAASYAKHGWPM